MPGSFVLAALGLPMDPLYATIEEFDRLWEPERSQLF
jgi:hypothetical protein